MLQSFANGNKLSQLQYSPKFKQETGYCNNMFKESLVQTVCCYNVLRESKVREFIVMICSESPRSNSLLL